MNTKIRKRLLPLLMAFITALSLCVPVSAAEPASAVSTIVDTALKDTMAQEKSALPAPGFGDEWVLMVRRTGFMQNLMEDTISEFQQRMWDNIKFTDYDTVTTSNFFEVYQEYFG